MIPRVQRQGLPVNLLAAVTPTHAVAGTYLDGSFGRGLLLLPIDPGCAPTGRSALILTKDSLCSKKEETGIGRKQNIFNLV